MSNFKTLTDNFAVSPQLKPAEFAQAAAEGFAMIINNRADGEMFGQMSSADAEAAAKAQGLAYAHVPVDGAALSPATGAAMAAALAQATGPVLAYCGSGKRSAAAWAIAQSVSGGLDPEAALAATKRAGYDLDALRPLLKTASSAAG